MYPNSARHSVQSYLSAVVALTMMLSVSAGERQLLVTPTDPTQLPIMLSIASSITQAVPSWNPNGDPCNDGNWAGVQCNPSGQITAISLSGNSLRVSIDVFSNLYLLPQLVTLELSNCNLLDGTLNPLWGNLPVLDKVDLSNNPNLSGYWPSTWNHVQMPEIFNYNAGGTAIQGAWSFWCVPPAAGTYVKTTCQGTGTSYSGSTVSQQTVTATCTTTPVPSGSFVSAVCQTGDYKTVGSDRQITSCTGLQPGQYVATACIAGSNTAVGKDTVLASCQTNLQAGYYVAAICVAGKTTLAGSDAITLPCSEPASGQYVQAICAPGSLALSLVGTNTVIKSCKSATIPIGSYVSQTCSPGTSVTTGQDAIITLCSTIVPGQFVVTPCVQGNYQTIGSDTVIAKCTAPPTGYYISKLCVAGSVTSLAGSDSNYTTCGTCPKAQPAYQSCFPGAYNVIGSAVGCSGSIKTAVSSPVLGLTTTDFIIIGVVLGVLLLLAIIFTLLRMRKKPKSAEAEGAGEGADEPLPGGGEAVAGEEEIAIVPVPSPTPARRQLRPRRSQSSGTPRRNTPRNV